MCTYKVMRLLYAQRTTSRPWRGCARCMPSSPRRYMRVCAHTKSCVCCMRSAQQAAHGVAAHGVCHLHPVDTCVYVRIQTHAFVVCAAHNKPPMAWLRTVYAIFTP